MRLRVSSKTESEANPGRVEVTMADAARLPPQQGMARMPAQGTIGTGHGEVAMLLSAEAATALVVGQEYELSFSPVAKLART